MMILTKRFCDPPNLSQIGFCGAKSGFLRCESMVFVVRKVGICGAKVWFFVGVRVYIAICSQRCCRPSAALSQSVSSRRGPIYRARIYVNTHEMWRGNACAVMWKCIFGNGKSVFGYVRIRAR